MRVPVLLRHILVASTFLISLVGCKEVDFQKQIDALDSARKISLEASQQTPYGESQYPAIKNYFFQIEQLALEISSEPKLVKGLNSVIKNGELNELCSRAFLPKTEWARIATECTRNSFFLCAEEVRSYEENLLTLKKLLTAEQATKFMNTPSCRAAIE